MRMQLPFENEAKKEKEQAIEDLIQHSSPRHEFFILVGLSVLMASLGIILDNDTVVIGSMLVAPIIYPMVSLALGMTILDLNLMVRSFVTFIQATVLSFVVSFTVGFLQWHAGHFLPESVFHRAIPSVSYLGVAFVAGLVAALSYAKPKVRSFGPFPGIAISVALIPPIAIAGLALSQMNLFLLKQSSLLYLMNVAGIIVAGYVIFMMMQFFEDRKMVQKKVAEDEKEIEKEEAEA